MQDKIIDMKQFKKQSEEKHNEEMDSIDKKLKIAQANGYLEMKQYERLVNKFIADVRELAAFHKIMDDVMTTQFRFFLIDEFLDSLVKPVFEGNRMPFLSEESFANMRKDMYSSLLSRYVDNEPKDDLPFF